MGVSPRGGKWLLVVPTPFLFEVKRNYGEALCLDAAELGCCLATTVSVYRLWRLKSRELQGAYRPETPNAAA
jgi:hypothetical protein